MKTPTKFQFYFFIIAMLLSHAAHSYPGESIQLDPVSGNYNITYWNESMEPPALETTVFVPATKIVPTIQSRFTFDSTGKITYKYTVSSAAQSKQTLGLIILDPVNSVIGTRDDSNMGMATAAESAAGMAVFKANKAALASPTGWDGSVSFATKSRIVGSVRVGWDPTYNLAMEKSGDGIKPGGSVRGFGFASYTLPGIIMTELSGDSPVHGWSGEGPTRNSAIFQQLIDIKDFVPLPAAAPTIPVPTPFNAAALIDRIQTQMHTWIAMQLLDATFSSQLDRYLAAAADAYRHNQPKAGKEHIHTLRRMLKKEHEDLGRDEEHESDKSQEKNDDKKTAMINRLAARVLDFDLKYVTKRMGDDKED